MSLLNTESRFRTCTNCEQILSQTEHRQGCHTVLVQLYMIETTVAMKIYEVYRHHSRRR